MKAKSLFAVVLVATSCWCIATAIPEEEVKAILAKVPKNQMRNFLTYHLNVGYQMEVNDDSNILLKTALGSVSSSIYKYVRKNVHIRPLNKRDMSEICFPFGCFDPEDPAIHP